MICSSPEQAAWGPFDRLADLEAAGGQVHAPIDLSTGSHQLMQQLRALWNSTIPAENSRTSACAFMPVRIVMRRLPGLTLDSMKSATAKEGDTVISDAALH